MYWFGGTLVTHVLLGGTVTHVLVWWNCHSCIGLVELSLMYCLVELSLMYWFGGTVTHALVWCNGSMSLCTVY